MRQRANPRHVKQEPPENEVRIAVVGLGYVGLPVAVAFSRAFPGTLGFDIDPERIEELRKGQDRTGEVTTEDLKSSVIRFSGQAELLKECNFVIVAVPTPIDADRRPDLRAVISASEIVGRNLSPKTTVVFESTVYPGVTEEVCGPVIERESGKKQGVDFFLGYSPERINPGDKEHSFQNIVKVVSGDTTKTLEHVANVYGAVVTAGVHRAPSIKVAEAAKVIENTQRDLNISLMNELSMIFDRMGISTKEVLDAAGTKWNFLRFTPGLVGGHCIGVDPYYLTTKAEQLGYRPQVILAGRRINDGMGPYIAQKTVKLLGRVSGVSLEKARVGILGITFKENIPDIRNSRVPSIVNELRDYGISTLVHDPHAESKEVEAEYGFSLSPWSNFKELDALIVAVSHREYVIRDVKDFIHLLRPKGVFIDVKSLYSRESVLKHAPAGLEYWSL